MRVARESRQADEGQVHPIGWVAVGVIGRHCKSSPANVKSVSGSHVVERQAGLVG
jgi:hypothetical protein